MHSTSGHMISVNPASGALVLLKRREAASLLNVSISSMDRWRLLGIGPIFRKLNGSVFYELADLQQFVAERGRIHTGEDRT